MLRNVMQFIVLFLVTCGICSAKHTVVRTPFGNQVQCNNWGWIEGNAQTVWKNDCAPLEVKSLDGAKVYAIPTTADLCDEDQFGMYHFIPGNNAIQFDGCQFLKQAKLPKNIHH